MSTVLAIDPGNTESAYAVIDQATLRPIDIGKIPNEQLLERLIDLSDDAAVAAIEMVASYGMPVGADVFETCVWIGRYQQLLAYGTFVPVDLVKRHPIKLHHCGSARAKDSNITQALVDRFASGQPNRGKGTKAAPGWFFGFAADIWQAYALAVYVADTATPPFETSAPVPAGTAERPDGRTEGEAAGRLVTTATVQEAFL